MFQVLFHRSSELLYSNFPLGTFLYRLSIILSYGTLAPGKLLMSYPRFYLFVLYYSES